MIIVRILAYLLGGFGVIGTALPFLTYDDYWIRSFDYPRQQLIFVLGASAVLWWISNTDWDRYDYLIAGVLLVSMCYQTYRMAPYTRLWPEQSASAQQPVTPETSISLMVCNVLQTNDQYGKVANLVLENQPDIFLSLESNDAWGQALHTALDPAYPHFVEVPLDNLYGMHLFSRLELEEPRVRYRIKNDIPSIDTRVTLGNGQQIDLYFLHPMPPSPSEAYASTGRDAELALVGKEVKKKGRTAIVAGDLNDVAWSHSSRLFQRLSGLLDPRIGRGLFATFHADYRFARWPLDHVFHSADLAVADLKRLGHVGSDHFPVFIRLTYEAAPGHSTPEPQGDDLQEANEVIEDGKQGDNHVLIAE